MNDIADFLATGRIASPCSWSDQQTVDVVAWLGENGQEQHLTCTEFTVAREYLSPEVIELCLSYEATTEPPPPRPYTVFVRWGYNGKTPIREYLNSEQFKEDVREKRVGEYSVPLSKMRFLGNMPGQPGLWYRPIVEDWDMIASYRVFTPEEAEDPVTAGVMKAEFEANGGELILHVVSLKTHKEAGFGPIPEDIARDFGAKETDVIQFSEHLCYRLNPKTGKVTKREKQDSSRTFRDCACGSGSIIIKE